MGHLASVGHTPVLYIIKIQATYYLSKGYLLLKYRQLNKLLLKYSTLSLNYRPFIIEVQAIFC